MNFNDVYDKTALGTLQYSRRLSVYLDAKNAGMTNDEAMARVAKIFSRAPLTAEQVRSMADGRAQARRDEDGE